MFEYLAVFNNYGYIETEELNHKVWSHYAAETPKRFKLIQVGEEDDKGVGHPLHVTDVRSVQMEHR